MADKLSVELDRLVCGPIRNIRSLVHGRYRQHQHGCVVTDLMECSLCNLSITNDVPAKAEWFEIPCCSKFVHLHCKELCASNPVCPGCGKLQVLPCIICGDAIKLEQPTDFLAAYKSTVKNRMVCCGADTHRDCASGFVNMPCPICRTSLTSSQVLAKEMMDWRHYLDMWLHRTYNSHRRAKNCSYYDRETRSRARSIAV